MKKRRVVITGTGVLSPVGSGTEKFWNALVSGQSGIRPITSFDTTLFDCKIAGDVIDYNPLDHFNTKEARHISRFVQFAIVASREAFRMAKLNGNSFDPDRAGAIIGSGIGSLKTMEEEYETFLHKGPKRISPFLIPKLIVNEAAGQVSIDLNLKGPTTCVTTACATASNAIGDAMRFIQYGDADLIIAGGTESANTVIGVGGFAALKALSLRNDEPEKASRPFELNRDGFVMAEGAGASKAMVNALKDAECQPKDISYINAHGTSTKLNDKVETLAIKKVFGELAKKVPVSSTKSMTGHLLGAAGGVEFIACIEAIRKSLIPPTINYDTPDPECDLDYVPNQARRAAVHTAMSNSLGFGGHNATLIVKKFQG